MENIKKYIQYVVPLILILSGEWMLAMELVSIAELHSYVSNDSDMEITIISFMCLNLGIIFIWTAQKKIENSKYINFRKKLYASDKISKNILARFYLECNQITAGRNRWASLDLYIPSILFIIFAEAMLILDICYQKTKGMPAVSFTIVIMYIALNTGIIGLWIATRKDEKDKRSNLESKFDDLKTML